MPNRSNVNRVIHTQGWGGGGAANLQSETPNGPDVSGIRTAKSGVEVVQSTYLLQHRMDQRQRDLYGERWGWRKRSPLTSYSNK